MDASASVITNVNPYNLGFAVEIKIFSQNNALIAKNRDYPLLAVSITACRLLKNMNFYCGSTISAGR